MTTAVPSRSFGQTPAGRDATLFTLENDRLRVCITDFGGRMVSLEAPDRYGQRDHVLLGFDTVAAYVSNSGSFGTPVRVHDPASERVLEVHTNQPGAQMYTASKLIGAFAGHDGAVYRQSAGLALEPPDFPDAPHHPNFPSTVLRPGEMYRRIHPVSFRISPISTIVISLTVSPEIPSRHFDSTFYT